MAFKQEQISKNYSEDLLEELINYQSSNLMGVRIHQGIQQLMELNRDDHIGVKSHERSDHSFNPGLVTWLKVSGRKDPHTVMLAQLL